MLVQDLGFCIKPKNKTARRGETSFISKRSTRTASATRTVLCKEDMKDRPKHETPRLEPLESINTGAVSQHDMPPNLPHKPLKNLGTLGKHHAFASFRGKAKKSEISS